jgi:aryl-alcohol dehydrogenase-like predicted oxidoreductase
MIPKRHLGKTGIEITPIGLGLLQFAGGQGIFKLVHHELSQETMNGIVKAAIDGNINWFDTAEIYANGDSERFLSRALKASGQTNSDVIIATKWFPLFRTAKNITKTINSRLECLDGYDIDLYQIHLPYSLSSTKQLMNQMAGLVEKGKIRSIGVSNYSADRMRRAHNFLAEHGLSLASNQVHYSLLNRRIETNGILDAAKELGITIIAYSPLESGLLTGNFHDSVNALNSRPFWRRVRLRAQLAKSRPVIDSLKEIAKSHNVTPVQVALNWLISFHGETVVAIPGASSPKQARDNAAAMNFTLSRAELDQIDQVTRKFL